MNTQQIDFFGSAEPQVALIPEPQAPAQPAVVYEKPDPDEYIQKLYQVKADADSDPLFQFMKHNRMGKFTANYLITELNINSINKLMAFQCPEWFEDDQKVRVERVVDLARKEIDAGKNVLKGWSQYEFD